METKQPIREQVKEFCKTVASNPVLAYLWGILTGVAFSILLWAIREVI